MNFLDFHRRAHEIFDGIPPEFREGVDGMEVRRAAVPHPSLPDVYTLGECLTESYPSEFGGAGEVRSIVVLYYGSFVELSRLDEHFDWAGELEETVLHEVRHHLESLASEDALEEMDYAEDQNFARRQGEPFDPFFYRSGVRLDDGGYEVDGDVFIEHEVAAERFGGAGPLRLPWRGGELRIPWPERLGDVHFLRVGGVVEEPAELLVVLVRRRGAWESVRALFSQAPLELLHSEVEAEGAS